MKTNKKAQILLLTIGAAALLSFTYATRDLSKVVYIPTTTAPTTLCPNTLRGVTTIDNGGRFLIVSATTTSTRPCSVITVWVTE